MAVEMLAVNGVVANTETMLRRLIGEHIALVVRLSKDPLLIKGDPSQLEQVVMNLVVNARDVMPQGGVAYGDCSD